MRLLLILLFLFSVTIAFSSIRVRREEFWGYKYSKRTDVWNNHEGYGDNSGKGSTWHGTGPEHISNSDISFFG